MLGTYFAGSSFYFTSFGVYYLAFVRADFISMLLLLLLTFTWELLFELFWILVLFPSFLPCYTLLIDRLLFNFFSLLDFLIAFLLSPLLPFLGSIDLWGDLLLDLSSLGSFFWLFSLVGDFCSFKFYGSLPFEFPGLLDRLLANFWSYFLFYRTPLFIFNKIIII